MNCNLVKVVVKSTIKKDGKDVEATFTNFYLEFDNGDVLPVECKYYSTRSQDKNDVEKINRINHDNYVKMSCLATLKK